MILRKIISGGQTGADQQGFVEGRRLGLETGGWVPKGWRTEDGPAPWLATFGCQEHPLSSYPPRTDANVRDSDATLWFGNTSSPGYYCTLKACEKYNRPFIVNPHPRDMVDLAWKYEVWNIAGNRASKNPGVAITVMEAFAPLDGRL